MANVRWSGAAGNVAQVSTITVAGTWATGETATVTINNQDLTTTVGTDTATTNVADIISRSVNASSTTDNLLNDETRNFGGQAIPEFTDVTATVSGSVVTLTSSTAGIPFTFASSETSTSGTLSDATTTSATGKNYFDNAENWEGGSLPVEDDTIIFDRGGISVLYGLANTIDDLQLIRTDGYTGNIGLTQTNTSGYVEYRQRHLDLPVNDAASLMHKIGHAGAGGLAHQGRTYIDFGTAGSTSHEVYVFGSQAAASDGPAVQIEGGDSVSIYAYSGSVSVGRTKGGIDAPLVKHIVIGTNGGGASAAIVILDTNCTYTDVAGDVFRIYSGSVDLKGTISGTNRTIELYGGTLTTEPGATLRDLDIYGGTAEFLHDTTNTCTVYGGTLDLSRMDTSHTFTNDVELYHGFSVIDPQGSYLGDYDFNGCNPSDGVWTLRDNLRATLASL